MVLYESAGHYEVNNKQLNITVQLSHKLLSQTINLIPNHWMMMFGVVATPEVECGKLPHLSSTSILIWGSKLAVRSPLYLDWIDPSYYQYIPKL